MYFNVEFINRKIKKNVCTSFVDDKMEIYLLSSFVICKKEIDKHEM